MAQPVMIGDFFSALQATGIASVTRGDLSFAKDAESSLAEMKQAFDTLCDDLAADPFGPPQWHPKAAADGVFYLYRLCQALVDRSLTEEAVTRLCASLPASPALPGEILSLDLSLRHLPELHTMARSISGNDPLVAGIENAALRFPLSAVGIENVPLPDLAPVAKHRGVWQLFIDRIIERQDAAKLRDPLVRHAVADALGEHARHLAPKLAAALVLSDAPDIASFAPPVSHSPSAP